MREVTNGEISGFQHFSACFVKTVMEHLQNNSPHTNNAFLDVKFHVWKECRSKTQLPHNKASTEKEQHGVKVCAGTLGLLWVRAFSRGAAMNRTLQ